MTGGGFVQLDPDKGRYVGMLELDIFDIGLTRDRDPGHQGRRRPRPARARLLAPVADRRVDLPPIQLGFGFTLIGVGGLAALNRRMDVAALLAGVAHRRA